MLRGVAKKPPKKPPKKLDTKYKFCCQQSKTHSTFKTLNSYIRQLLRSAGKLLPIQLSHLTLISLISRIHSFTRLFNFPKIKILLIEQISIKYQVVCYSRSLLIKMKKLSIDDFLNFNQFLSYQKESL